MKIRRNLSVEFSLGTDCTATAVFLKQLPAVENIRIEARVYCDLRDISEAEYRETIREMVMHRGVGAIRYCNGSREILLMTDDLGNLIELGN